MKAKKVLSKACCHFCEDREHLRDRETLTVHSELEKLILREFRRRAIGDAIWVLVKVLFFDVSGSADLLDSYLSAVGLTSA